ncbi:MAG: alkaline phosphatase family protein [Gammaproteobacteria bacterium]|nr:alkaline phosphatase family protein [Gammaproteobacteria bacterium]
MHSFLRSIARRSITPLFICVFSFAAFMLPLAAVGAPIEYVVHISIDGLRPDAITTLGPGSAPNFYRLRTEGAFTDNARTDVNYTRTLPNHTSQLTGRGVNGVSGHNYTSNVMPPTSLTIHNNKGEYVNSVFNVAHDNGLSTGLYASKDKFVIFDQSYDQQIDSYRYDANTGVLLNDYLTAMTSTPFQYSMLHLRDPDSTGHAATWNLTPGSSYLNSVAAIDDALGDVLNTIESDTTLFGSTAIILTSDHGGQLGTYTHDPAVDSENYTIPFYVWGAGITAGMDLYLLNLFSRTDPGATQPAYTDPNQPIRNGDAANLALDLLGLGPVPGSTINALQDLNVSVVPVPAAAYLFGSALGLLGWARRKKV